MKISEYYDLPDFDPNNLSKAKIKHYIDITKKKFMRGKMPRKKIHAKEKVKKKNSCRRKVQL